MAKIGLIQVDGKLPNLALMKVSSYYKSLGYQIEWANLYNRPQYEKVFASVLFTWNKPQADLLSRQYENIEIGGTGWDVVKTLPSEIESCKPDYNLYSLEDILRLNSSGSARGAKTKKSHLKHCEDILNMGFGFSSRGCVRNCEFCFVPKKEGMIRQATPISEIINPRSNIITLLDNNMTADPLCVGKLTEIKDRELVVNLCQGIDIRLMTDEKAMAFGAVKHYKQIHYSWDLMEYENSVWEGIEILSNHIKPYKQMCYVLCGFNTTFEEDMYRVQKLMGFGISPYIMIYNKRSDDKRLSYFQSWVNRRVCRADSFENYMPYIKWQAKSNGPLFEKLNYPTDERGVNYEKYVR